MEWKMNKLAGFFLVGAVLLGAMPALAGDREARAEAANRAANITLGNSGGGLDNAALRSVRKLVGKAINRGTVETFAVYSPIVGGPIPIEGGLSVCAEAGFGSTPKEFNDCVNQLRAIRPKTGTYLNVELTNQ